MALVFMVFGLYGLSGAGVIRRLPWLRPCLFGIGLIYTLRDIPRIPQILVVLGILPSPQAIPLAHLLVSLGSLVAGLAHLIGLAVGWRWITIKTVRIV
jgi:hypothetical protein